MFSIIGFLPADEKGIKVINPYFMPITDNYKLQA
jgi:hypothetical protein